MEKYTEAPSMITSKDLDYLADMFNWNYNAYKLSKDFACNIEDEEARKLLESISNIYMNHIKNIKSILK